MSKPTRSIAHPLVAAITLVVLILALEGHSALAGQYHVYSCRTPNEQPSAADGWTKSTVPASAGSVVAENTCATGGALVAAVKDGAEHEVGTSAEWELDTPRGEHLTAATVWRAGQANGGYVANAYYEFWMAGPEDLDRPPDVFDECVSGFSCPPGGIGNSTQVRATENLVGVPSERLTGHVYVHASCGGEPKASCPEGKNDPSGYAAAVYLYAADLVLEDTSQPTVVPSSITGELAGASTLSGKASLLFTADDEGSGVRSAVVSVDGTALAPTQLDSNGGHCADLGEATDGLSGYEYMQPCASSVSSDVQLDTTSLSNGLHRLTVVVEDAAGNATTVLDKQIDVANPVLAATGGGAGTSAIGVGASPALGLPNGSPASSPALLTARWAATAKLGYAGRWGKAARIVGRLTTPSGAPIANATIEANATPSSQGAKARPIGAPLTGPDGRFSLKLSPRSGSERIALGYRAHSGDATPAATSTLVLAVPAHLTLRVAPSASHVHGTIRFSGVLAGAPMPAGGKQLALQAHAPGAPWRTFQLLSTDGRGRFRSSYRFRLPGPVVYRFRAVSPHEADFPFGKGTSNVVKVRER